MNLPRHIARRYLFAPKSHTVINLIAGLSVVSVAMPVAAMLILLSVFNGFESLIRQMGGTFDADLTLTPAEGATFETARLDTAALATTPGVEALSFILEQNILLERHGRQAVATLRGADDAYSRVLPLDSLMTAGDARLRIGELERLLIGQTMAYTLGIRTLADAEVTLYALRRSSFSTLLPLDSYTRRRVETGGVYALDLDTERRYVLSSLRLARELFNYPDRASALLLRTSPGADPAEVAARVARIAGDDFRIRTRAEMQASLYRIMRYEKWGIFFISLLVLVIASFSIVGALAMLIVEKRDDAATLRALGADTSFLRRLFRQEGLLISASGAVLGLVLGLGATLLQQHYGLIRIPAESFLMQSYPVEFRWGDLLAVAAAFAVTAGTITWVTVRSMIKRTEP